eukprot:TRINITY_DN33812_c0_g2_i2.p1 TRINITY_DN33812_c0_g2~~TRINITY_DN33812_c0_g2_i2.p1  ORF type:complete len:506 (-),score=115.38 TRINITY_DN33812_c0_g2_i2:39-1490(-)
MGACQVNPGCDAAYEFDQAEYSPYMKKQGPQATQTLTGASLQTMESHHPAAAVPIVNLGSAAGAGAIGAGALAAAGVAGGAPKVAAAFNPRALYARSDRSCRSCWGLLTQGAERDEAMEEEHLVVAFTMRLEQQALETFHDARKTLFCGHVAENLNCDRVEILKVHAGSTVVEAQAVGFINEGQREEAVEKLRRGNALNVDLFGPSRLQSEPMRTTTMHRASAWLQASREAYKQQLQAGVFDTAPATPGMVDQASGATAVGQYAMDATSGPMATQGKAALATAGASAAAGAAAAGHAVQDGLSHLGAQLQSMLPDSVNTHQSPASSAAGSPSRSPQLARQAVAAAPLAAALPPAPQQLHAQLQSELRGQALAAGQAQARAGLAGAQAGLAGAHGQAQAGLSAAQTQAQAGVASAHTQAQSSLAGAQTGLQGGWQQFQQQAAGFYGGFMGPSTSPNSAGSPAAQGPQGHHAGVAPAQPMLVPAY